MFVKNRVNKITSVTEGCIWNYVPTKDNVADDATRGVEANDLTPDHRWFTGPAFLSCDEPLWPVQPNLVFVQMV